MSEERDWPWAVRTRAGWGIVTVKVALLFVGLWAFQLTEASGAPAIALLSCAAIFVGGISLVFGPGEWSFMVPAAALLAPFLAAAAVANASYVFLTGWEQPIGYAAAVLVGAASFVVVIWYAAKVDDPEADHVASEAKEVSSP